MNAELVRILSLIKRISLSLACILGLWVRVAFAEQSPLDHLKSAVAFQEEIEVLEGFFHKLLFERGFAYTLFGDKPISTEHYELGNPNKPELFLCSDQGYQTWKKYAHLFSTKSYIFLFDEDFENDLCEITLINKKAFRQVVSEHREKFATLFGPGINPEKLFKLLIEKRSLWNTPMKDRDDLIGILLGFGKHNAELFQKRSEITSYKLKLSRDRTRPSPGYPSVAEELEFLNAKLLAFSPEGRPSLNAMRLPCFVADPHHQETKKLKKKYIKQRKIIIQHYLRQNALNITLERLHTEPELKPQ